jgi:site-specific recombinase XerD
MARPSPAGARGLDALIERYLAAVDAEKNLSRFTLRNYASDLRHMLAYFEAQQRDPLKIARADFRGYLASMMEASVAQGSIVRRVSTARSFFRWLRADGVIEDDPLANVRGPRQAKRLPRALTLDDITALIAAANGDKPSDLRDRALLELLYAAGLRISEAAGLDLPDVDLDHHTVRVRGKGNKERLVLMGGPARRAIEVYLRMGRAYLLSGGVDTKRRVNPAALFVNRFGGRLSQRRIQLVVRKHALRAGIDQRIHPHLLRHTFATHLLDGGAELRVVQELMGHASPNTTQIYLHVTEERQRKAMDDARDTVAALEAARRDERSRERRGAPDAPVR